MSKFSNETISRWTDSVNDWLFAAGDPGNNKDVFLGAEAWIIAHRVGITREAYKDESVVDAHIKTALQKIFPNAVFKDKYSY